MYVRRLVLAAGFALGFTVVCPAAPAAPDAAGVYMRYCSVCHGDHGDGNTHVRQGLRPPPSDFTSPQAATVLTRDRMIASVRDGRPGTAMIAWGGELSESEIAAVVDYIRERFFAAAAAPPHRGRDIYAATCSVCHGDDGAGAVWGRTSLKPAPVDFTSPAVQGRLTRERMILSVLHGRPGTAMQAYSTRLSPQEVESVVDYIRGDFMTPASTRTALITGSAASRSLPAKEHTAFTPPPPGDAAHGKTLYMNNCTACHGDSGDGNGPRAYFIFPRPLSFVSSTNRTRFNRARLFSSVKYGVRGREMPAWGKVLDDQQIADISEFVYRAFIRPAHSLDNTQ